MKLIIPKVGTLTNGNDSDDAIILEARWLLAHRYNWNERCVLADRTFSNETKFSVPELLGMWDSYNQFESNRQRRDYYLMTKLELDDWDEQKLSTKAHSDLEAGLESSKTQSSEYLGSFAKYATSDDK